MSANYIVLFVIIALGFILGRIKIKGISLDVSAVIFVALLFGHLGYTVPKDIQYIGLLLFIFTVGIQAGPGFFRAFKSQGIQLTILAITLVVSAAIVTVVLAYAFNVDMNIAAGLFTGALTSTPGLAVAIDSTQSPLASIGYGVAYPFGVLGVILFVKFLPKVIKQDISESEKEIKQKTLQDNPVVSNQNFVVENENITGKSLAELKIPEMTGANISRVKHQSESITPEASTILHKGDLIKAVGTAEALNNVGVLIGRKTDEQIGLGMDYEVNSFLVTNKTVVNKTVEQLNLFKTYNATITRIKRSSIDITPTKHTHIQFGDKLTIACSKEQMKHIVKLLGNDSQTLSSTDFLPIALGIVIGFLVGKIQFSFGDKFSIQLGLTGGVLITAIVLAKLGKTGPIIWTMSGVANNLLRLIGLLFFLSAVGTNAGSKLVETYQQYGFKLFVMGAIITTVPMILMVIVSQLFFKINLLTMMGALTGSMTSTPGLAAVDSMTRTNAPHLAYATVYPIAMVFLIICVHILSYL